MEEEVESNCRGGGGRGEVRRVNVVYFLSRNGRVEHPHLLRIHRLHRDRVHLRDVKRWLSEFRGKDISDSFAWSYKRRYRGGYIWQDLRDDDLITPFADNEYILKGSELLLNSPMISNPAEQVVQQQLHMTPLLPSVEDNACGDDDEKTPKAIILNKPEVVAEAGGESTHILSRINDRSLDQIMICPKPPPEVPDGDSSSGTSDEEPPKREGDESNKEQDDEKLPKEEEENKKAAASLLEGSSSTGDSNNCSKRVTQVIRDILKCKTTVQTDDDALRPISRRQGRRGRSDSGDDDDTNSRKGNLRNGGKGDSSKAGAAAVYKPTNCSECGKAFKPRKLHEHMKSCKGLTVYRRRRYRRRERSDGYQIN